MSFDLPARFAFGGVPVRFTVPGLTMKSAVKFWALFHDIFGETECGLCKSKDIYFAAAGKGGTMLRLQCAKCPGQLDIGTGKDEKDQNIWVKRWDKDAQAEMPARGWHVYQRQNGGTDYGPGSGDAAEGPAAGGGDPRNDLGEVPW
jgi:hypothetical protein